MMIVQDVPCPRCGADRGNICVSRSGRPVKPSEIHSERHDAFDIRLQRQERRVNP